MARGGFIALLWRTSGEPPLRLAHVRERLDHASGLRAAADLNGAAVWTAGACDLPLLVLPNAPGLVIGDVFDANGQAPDVAPLDRLCRWATARTVAAALSAETWGRYVALWRDAHDEPWAYRDPSGQIQALSWSMGDGVEIVASDLALAPPAVRPPRQSLNWDRVATFAAAPWTMSSTPLFDGVVAAEPGALMALGEARSRNELIWSPARLARALIDDPAGAGQSVRERVVSCTAALARRSAPLVAEISGGLDSAVVAGALSAAGAVEAVRLWLTRAAVERPADERAYAQAVADRLGVALTIAPRPVVAISAEDLMELATATWPSLTGIEPRSDREMAGHVAALGARGILSGQGGDASFFQMPAAQVAADAWSRLGWRLLRSPLLPAVARRTHQSVWRVLAQAAAARLGRIPVEMPPMAVVTAAAAELGAGAAHAWVRDADRQEASPAKRLQIEALANCQLFNDHSRKALQADLVFPLLAQPVVETCLGVPAAVLAGGAFDRPFERAAFADLLPEAVRTRRSKGSLEVFYGRVVAASLETFRPLLLDGAAAAAGVLDRGRLEILLTWDSLLQHGHASELLWAASLEAWVQHWQRYVPDSAVAPRARPAD